MNNPTIPGLHSMIARKSERIDELERENLELRTTIDSQAQEIARLEALLHTAATIATTRESIGTQAAEILDCKKRIHALVESALLRTAKIEEQAAEIAATREICRENMVLRGESQTKNAALREAAEAFEEYGRMHRAKAKTKEEPDDWSPTERSMYAGDLEYERNACLAKAESNEARARKCREAIGEAQPADEKGGGG